MIAIEKRGLVVRGGILRIASVSDEADLDIPDPLSFLEELRGKHRTGIDIFTFGQRIPYTKPMYEFSMQWDSIAALDYRSHKYWFEKILDDKTRNMVRKAGKKGAEIRVVAFNDEFVRGILEIYNEAPVRQGRKFKHYGKTLEEAKESNATHLDRSAFIGAYWQEELIGFIKLVYGDRTARAEQIISKIAHRDKAPTNALIDSAVRLCEERKIPYLLYGIWPVKESFAQFKKNSGFREFRLPRFYVPLNAKGRLGLKMGFHREFRQRVPRALMTKFLDLRERWTSSKQKGQPSA